VYDKNTKETTEDKSWIPGQIVEGGKIKLINYIKKKARELKMQIEDSPKTVMDMKLNDLYINNVPESVTLMEHIKMYGGGLNYMHYKLMAGEYTGTCVPDYLVETLNNPNEKDRNRRLKKLNHENVLVELGMKTKTEGCTLEQMITFCDRRNITYYALNYKYATFRTNAGDKTRKRTNLPALYFMVACNHLYAITDQTQQRSICSINSKVGGLCKIIKQNVKKTIYSPGEQTKVIIAYESHFLEHIRQRHNNFDPEFDDCTTRVISTEKGMINSYFYDLLERKLVYGAKVTIRDHRVTRFSLSENIIYEENVDYMDVKCTIDELNDGVAVEKQKYVYTGQPLHMLAHEYYMNTYDKRIESSMSPQIFEIFESQLSKNSAFNEFYDKHIDIAIDKNKFYAFILQTCDSFGWSRFTPEDEIQHFDGEIQTGIFYIETNRGFPLRGNGWYFDGVVQGALEHELITKFDIKYQVKASLKLLPYHFKQFVLDLFEKFYNPKQAVVAFIGYLAKNYIAHDKSYFTSDIDTVAAEFCNSDGSMTVKTVYGKHHQNSSSSRCDLIDIDYNEIQAVIDKQHDDVIKPVCFHMRAVKKYKQAINTLSIQRKIYDLANMLLYETHLQVMRLNPNARLVGIKTDLLAYQNVTNMIPTHRERWGDVKIEDVPKINNRTIVLPGHNIRTDTYTARIEDWTLIEPNHLDVVFNVGDCAFVNPDLANSLLENGMLLTGRAGTGKSTILNLFKKMLVRQSAVDSDDTLIPTCVVSAFTHKACKIVNGYTIHKLFGIHPFTLEWSYKIAKSIRDSGVTHVLIDEISMIPLGLWGVLAHIKYEFGFIFIGFGDWKQLKPVNENSIDFKNLQIIKYLFDYKHCVLTKVHRFEDDDGLLQDAHDCANGDPIDFARYNNKGHDLSVAWTNQCVNALNKYWNEYYAQNFDEKLKLIVDGNDKTKIILYPGLELVSYLTPRNGIYSNAETLIVKSWQKKSRTQQDSDLSNLPGLATIKKIIKKQKKDYYEITLVNDDNVEVIVEDTDMIHFRPGYSLTVYKAQGMSIDRDYSIYEHEQMIENGYHDMVYVALTRTRKKQYVNFCSIDLLKPYTGHIYKCTLQVDSMTSGCKSYIGSAHDVTKRWNEHKQFKGTSKFIHALKQYGTDNFKWEIIDTIQYAHRNELLALEDQYILQHDSISNGFNSRFNLQQTLEINN
jgi:hypothetical protein